MTMLVHVAAHTQSSTSNPGAMTLPPTNLPYAVAILALLGSVIGALAAITSQLLSQKLTADRERKANLIREERVRALFITRILSLSMPITTMIESAKHGQPLNEIAESFRHT